MSAEVQGGVQRCQTIDGKELYRGGAANFKVVRPGSGCGLGVALFQLVIAIMTI